MEKNTEELSKERKTNRNTFSRKKTAGNKSIKIMVHIFFKNNLDDFSLDSKPLKKLAVHKNKPFSCIIYI